MGMTVERRAACDVLVVGSGLAGLRAAYDCAKAGLRVVLASKGPLCSGASFYPLVDGLGAQLPADDADRAVFLRELLEVGDGIADETLCRILVDEVAAEVARLPQLGIETRRIEGRVSCFAKRERRIVTWDDWPAIRRRVTDIFAAEPSLAVWEHCDLLRLVVQNDAVCGALLCCEAGELAYLETPAVILATGGFCGLYKHSLNTPDVCGIGHSVALDAGARLINLEFLQFIPGLTRPLYKMLFGEVVLWHCTGVADEAGRPALLEYLPKGVALADVLQKRSMHGPFTSADNSKYFDLAMMHNAIETGSEAGFTLSFDKAIAQDGNGFVRNILALYEAKGIHLDKEDISISSFAHCANGGVWIDEDAATGVPGLFAAGEVAGGVHGADRHGGAATAACLVFGRRAAQSAVAWAKNHSAAQADEDEAANALWQWWDAGEKGGPGPDEVLKALEAPLWLAANVLRSEAGLQELLDLTQDLRRRYSAASSIQNGCGIKQAAKAFHALRTVEAASKAMLLRRESRGAHYRQDYPHRDKALLGRRVTVAENIGISAGFI